jgi:hypothetical protein
VTFRNWLRYGLGVTVGVGLIVGTATAVASARETPAAPGAGAGGQATYSAAAAEFKVPDQVLLAYSYALTGWDDHAGKPSAAGGYGPMHLTAPDALESPGRGTVQPPRSGLNADPARTTLARASGLLGVPAERLKTEPQLNIRGGAALLADEARKLGGGRLPAAVGDWYPAVAALSGSPGTAGATAFADDVYQIMNTGAGRTTRNGWHIQMGGSTVTPRRDVGALGLRRDATPGDPPRAECPAGLNCRFIPAAYEWTDTSNANAYGNYDPANRPADGNKIRYIVIHDTEGSYDGTVSEFQDPKAEVSAHYVIRSSDGAVTQMVRTKDIAWHAGSWNINMQSIGIEHEGVAVDGATWYTDAMYRSSAKLVRYLAARYGIPLDRDHIIGHEDVVNPNHYADSHWDPGAFWDWDRYMRLLGAPVQPPVYGGQLVRIAPSFASNKPAFTYCPTGPSSCRDVPAQPSNALLLRTEPRSDAPLLSDPDLSGGVGTTDLADWSNKAVTGRRYAVAERRGDWLGIWYAGQKAWLFDPGGTNTRAAAGPAVRPKAGRTTIPVYANAVPESSEWPQGVPAEGPPQAVVPLHQNILAGQVYPLLAWQQAEYYYARFDGAGVPRNHTMMRGGTVYFLISYHHRFAYVRLSDVDIC